MQFLPLFVVLNFIALQNVNGSPYYPPNEAKLGKTGRGMKPKIVGGTNAIPNEFPFQIRLDINGGKCGGVVVNANFVVTASHCFTETDDPMYVDVVAGEHRISKQEGHEQMKEVSKVIIHEKYRHDKVTQTYHNDIAILKLSSPLELNKFVQPIALPPSNYVAKGDVTVSGWGLLESNTDKEADRLQKVTLKVVDNKKCQTIFQKYEIKVTDKILCADNSGKGGKDACQGDSGGPLITYQGEKPMLVGIVSAGIDCGRPEFPSIFTDVAKYRSWIDSKIN